MQIACQQKNGTHCTLRTKLTLWYAMCNAYQNFIGTQFAWRTKRRLVRGKNQQIIKRTKKCIWYAMRIAYQKIIRIAYCVPKCNFGTQCTMRTKKKKLVHIVHCVPNGKFGTQCALRPKTNFLRIAHWFVWQKLTKNKFWYALYIAYQMVSLVRNVQCVPKTDFGTLCA